MRGRSFLSRSFGGLSQPWLLFSHEVVLVFRLFSTPCDPLRVNTATRAATDLNAATDLELQLPQKGGDKEGVMANVELF